jgi:ubiquinone biosynthesis protein UbiJ
VIELGIGQSIQAISVTHPLSINRKIDQYLSERLPLMMDEYKIADRNDVADVDNQFEKLESKMDELEKWKKGFNERLTTGRTRLDRLKMKYGVK